MLHINTGAEVLVRIKHKMSTGKDKEVMYNSHPISVQNVATACCEGDFTKVKRILTRGKNNRRQASKSEMQGTPKTSRKRKQNINREENPN